MLKNVPKLLSPELLKILSEMGHGDEIVIADANFPSANYGKRVIRADGISGCEMLEAVLSVFPLDTYSNPNMILMQLMDCDVGKINPFITPDDDDKKLIYPERLTEEEKEYIANAFDCNNSDIDFCDYKGKTIIMYSWGNQHGKEFLAMAEYDGSLQEI